MSARLALLAALLAAACTPTPAPAPALGTEPPRTDLAAACGDRDGWSDPAPAAHVRGNVWDVGTCGITVLLITSPAGHVLIDAGPAEAAPAVLANIRAAGFDPADVRWLLISHEHNDHVGGLAQIKAATGAKIAAGSAAAAVLEHGQVFSDDPQARIHQPFPPAHVDRVLSDGEVMSLGPIAMTMHATPVHSPGSSSWTWVTADNTGKSERITYADSLTAISADDYNFADHPGRVDAIRAGLDVAERLDCGILLTPHPGASNMFERLAGRAALVDRAACRTYARAARARFEERLARERAQ